MLFKSLRIEGLFNRYDYNIQLDKEENITILYGLNSIGKTTMEKAKKFFSNLYDSLYDISIKAFKEI